MLNDQETPRLCSYFVILNLRGCPPYNGLYVWAGGGGRVGVGTAFFRLQVHESEEISLAEVNERVGKTVISVC